MGGDVHFEAAKGSDQATLQPLDGVGGDALFPQEPTKDPALPRQQGSHQVLEETVNDADLGGSGKYGSDSDTEEKISIDTFPQDGCTADTGDENDTAPAADSNDSSDLFPAPKAKAGRKMLNVALGGAEYVKDITRTVFQSAAEAERALGTMEFFIHDMEREGVPNSQVCEYAREIRSVMQKDSYPVCF